MQKAELNITLLEFVKKYGNTLSVTEGDMRAIYKFATVNPNAMYKQFVPFIGKNSDGRIVFNEAWVLDRLATIKMIRGVITEEQAEELSASAKNGETKRVAA